MWLAYRGDMNAFSDPDAVAHYAAGPPRLVPGFAGMQRMIMVLLAERAPSDARVLVLGAGGGLELRAFAEAQPGWTFDGIDPSAEMLKLAEQTLGAFSSRAHLHLGLIDIAPDGPFDAATCILTMHFMPREERLHTLQEIRRRLRPGAPFAVTHFSFPQTTESRDLWLARYAAFAVASGVDPVLAENGRSRISAILPILAPEDDELLLCDAGFSGITLFYVGLAIRGWVAYA